MQKLFRFCSIVVCIVFLPVEIPLLAQVPDLITFQGKLTDTQTNVLNGSYNLTFRLYITNLSGTSLWAETQTNVPVTRGIFAVPLGVRQPLTLPFDQPYWISIQVGNDAEMAARVALNATPYARMAASVSDGSITSAKLANGAVGSSQLGTSAVRSNNIANGAVGAAQIAAGSVGVPQLAPGTLLGGFNGIQAFTTSGSYTWNTPTNITKVYVRLWGAGGGGGMGSCGGGGGGGSGAYVESVQPVAGVITVVIGAGGSPDNSGGDTSFGLMVAPGGSPGGDGSFYGGGGLGETVVCPQTAQFKKWGILDYLVVMVSVINMEAAQLLVTEVVVANQTRFYLVPGWEEVVEIMVPEHQGREAWS